MIVISLTLVQPCFQAPSSALVPPWNNESREERALRKEPGNEVETGAYETMKYDTFRHETAEIENDP